LEDVSLLVIDNLSTLIRSGEENAAESWQPIQDWLLSLRKRGISVLMLHHSGRSGLQRGTSKREDTLDTSIKLVQPPDYEPKDGARFEIHFDKWRGDPQGSEPIEAKYETIDGNAEWTWKKCTDALTDRIATMLNEGLSQREISRELKVGVATVNR